MIHLIILFIKVLMYNSQKINSLLDLYLLLIYVFYANMCHKIWNIKYEICYN